VLVCDTNQRGTYCTLSYRWSSNPVTLQTKNLDSFRRALPTTELPLTISFAIRVARILGFKYLWVDALCILQDSEDDWKAEAVKMDTIYFNSTLTIAVVDGPTCLPGEAAPGSRKPEHGWRPLGELDTRGWVAQEEILSRRILSFTDGGVFWSCKMWNCSEWNPTGISDTSNSLKYNINRKVQSWVPEKAKGYELWRAVLQDYAKRQLTEESDRFIALRGIASFFSSRLQDKIIAGIWMGNIKTDLAWYSPSPQPIRPTSCVAPSWSWGSVSGPISYTDDEAHLADIDILDVQVSESGKGFTGSITLAGALIPVVFHGRTLSFIPAKNAKHPKIFEPGIPSNPNHVKNMKQGSEWRPDEQQYQYGAGFALHMGGYALGLVPANAEATTFKRAGLCLWGSDLCRSISCCFKFGPLSKTRTAVRLV